MDGVGSILKTTSGGETWLQSFWLGGGGLRAVSFIDSSNIWAVGWFSGMEGSYQCFVKTTDGGANWNLSYLAGVLIRNSYLNDVYFLSDSTILAVGEFYPIGGNVVKTTDGGESWEEVLTSSEAKYSGLSVVSESTWFVVGNYENIGGIVMRTTDAGISWGNYYFFPHYPSALYSVYFSDFNTGYIVGTKSVLDGRVCTIFRTTDNGNNWIPTLDLGAYGCGQLMDVYFIDSIKGWAVGQNVCGSNVTILHTTNGGVSFVEEEEIDEVPTEFLLSQNYPNPFNPTTSIQYAISSRQFVKLTIYDLLGREIETLVNEEKPAGSYEVTWYAEQLPSGVYFYQLKAGEFIQTKKMLLLK